MSSDRFELDEEDRAEIEDELEIATDPFDVLEDDREIRTDGGNASSGTARCSCGWSVDANTPNQAEAAAVGHNHATGHLEMVVNGQSLETATERSGGSR